MKATIRDGETLRGIRPLDLAAYLRANRWQEAERHDGRYALWRREIRNDQLEVLLPLNRELRDYAPRMAEALHALELTEQRSQTEIIADIAAVGDDTLRISVEHEHFADGTMPLEAAARFVDATAALVLAAACGAARPREVYFSRKPQAAIAYMRQVRIGQTERGSYVLTVRAAVPPALRAPGARGEEEPFARRVSQTLVRALTTVRSAADEAAATGEFGPFAAAVATGVSANLCDAVVAMQESTGADAIGVRVAYSPVRAARAGALTAVTINADAVPVIREAARFLREAATREDYTLHGFVTVLRRHTTGALGRVTISGLIDGVFRNVQADLLPDSYEQALLAHRERLPISVVGELAREGRSWVLLHSREFVVETAGEEES